MQNVVPRPNLMALPSGRPEPLMNVSVEQLCESARAGDHTSASLLIEHTYGRIYSFHRRHCSSDSDAADLTQQTFCQMWASLPSFRGESMFTTWLHGIAYNVYRSWRRGSKPTESASDEWWEQCPELLPSPFQQTS